MEVVYSSQKIGSFPLRISSVNGRSPQLTECLGKFTGETLNRKLHFLCSGSKEFQVNVLGKIERSNWERKTAGKVFRRKEVFFSMKYFKAGIGARTPLDLVLNLDQTPISYVSLGKYTFSSKRSKNVPLKGLDYKRQITATFFVSASGSFPPIRRI